MDNQDVANILAQALNQVANSATTIVIISTSPAGSTPAAGTSGTLLSCITEEAVRLGKAQQVDAELRAAAEGSAAMLIAALRTNEALGYVRTAHLSSKKLYTLLDERYGLHYKPHHFAVCRSQKH